jgi:predicted GNAT superfamily acetyltransferase
VLNRRTAEALKDAPELFIAIPEDIQDLIAKAPATAREWRESTRAAFLHYLTNGYRVTGFQRFGGSGFYRLTRGTD